MDTRKVGSFGERVAERYLRNKGYQILDRNYFLRFPGGPKMGEIDIVAKKDDIISFVEVKTLRDAEILPEEKINFSKKRKLRKAAESWLMKRKIPLNSKWQIDVISVKIDQGQAKISHFPNAVSYH